MLITFQGKACPLNYLSASALPIHHEGHMGIPISIYTTSCPTCTILRFSQLWQLLRSSDSSSDNGGLFEHSYSSNDTRHLITRASMEALKVLGKSVGLCKTSKRKDQSYISLLVSVWRIICENFNPNGLILAEIWMKIFINKENKKNSGFWRSVTVTLSHHYHR